VTSQNWGVTLEVVLVHSPTMLLNHLLKLWFLFVTYSTYFYYYCFYCLYSSSSWAFILQRRCLWSTLSECYGWGTYCSTLDSYMGSSSIVTKKLSYWISLGTQNIKKIRWLSSKV